MAKEAKKVNSKGKEIKEYPKLVRVSEGKNGKVLVNNAEEEAKLTAEPEGGKKKAWG